MPSTFSWPPWPRATGISWIAKVSANGTALWARPVGPAVPEGVTPPIVQVGRAGSLTFSGIGTLDAATGLSGSGAAGRRLHADSASAEQLALIVTYAAADVPPALSVYVQANATLAGFYADNFTTAAQGAFTSAVAATLNVAASAVAITAWADSPPAAAAAGHRRHVLAAASGGLVVSFAVGATSATAAAALGANMTATLAGSGFLTQLQSAFTAAGVTQPVAGVSTTVAPLAVGGGGSPSAGVTAAAPRILLLLACLLSVALA